MWMQQQLKLAVSLNHDIMTSFWLHKWPRSTQSDPSTSSVCIIYLRLMPYAHGQHNNVLEHFVYVWCGCRKHFEVAVSLNHDRMTSFWFHKWPRSTKYEPRKVGITVRGYYHIPMNSISIMCSNTLYMYNLDAGSSSNWLSASTAGWRGTNWAQSPPDLEWYLDVLVKHTTGIPPLAA